MGAEARDHVGFAVVYRWRIHAGKEEQFQEAWERVTRVFLAERKALGSRLHRSEDDTWVAYAQWPSKAHWERSNELGPIDEATWSSMRSAIAESFEPLLLEPVRDLLAHE